MDACVCLAETQPLLSYFLGKEGPGFGGFSTGDLRVLTLQEDVDRPVVVGTAVTLYSGSFSCLLRETLANGVIGIGKGSLATSRCFLFEAAPARGSSVPAKFKGISCDS